jgi:hypothetical protein
MSGVVREMRQKLALAKKATGPAPAGIGSLFADLPPIVASTDDIVLHVKDIPNIPAGEQSDYDDEESDDEEEEGEFIEKK